MSGVVSGWSLNSCLTMFGWCLRDVWVYSDEVCLCREKSETKNMPWIQRPSAKSSEQSQEKSNESNNMSHLCHVLSWGQMSQASRLMFFLALTSTMGMSPPQSSANKPSSESICRVCWGSAPSWFEDHQTKMSPNVKQTNTSGKLTQHTTPIARFHVSFSINSWWTHVNPSELQDASMTSAWRQHDACKTQPRDHRVTTESPPSHHQDTSRPGRQPGTRRRLSAFRINSPKLSLYWGI